jgi:hypothetical protein
MNDKQSAASDASVTKPVELSKIHAPYGWNSRSERNVQDMADTENAGFEGFAANIRAQGQVTACILRNTHGKLLDGTTTDKPFELLVGIENTGRKNLKAPDLVFLAKELEKAGMAQVPIAGALGITQGWVSKLLKVGALPPAVLNHWRNNAAIPAVQTKDGVFKIDAGANGKADGIELTEPEMRALAELKGTPDEVTARYIRLVKPEVQGDGTGAPEASTDKVAAEVAYIAGLMGCMVRAGVLDNASLDWNRVIGPKKKGYPIDCGKDDSQDRLLALGDIAKEAFEKEVTKAAKGAAEQPKSASAN